MTLPQAVLLALRLAALYVWSQSLQFALTGVSFFLDGSARGAIGMTPIWSWLASAVLLALLGGALYERAPAIARRSAGPSGDAPLERRDLWALGLRLGGVVLVIEAIEQARHALFSWRFGEMAQLWGLFVGNVGSMLALGVLGAWLFFRAERIAAHRTTDASLPSGVQAVAFSVAGLWLLAQSFPGVLALATPWLIPAGWRAGLVGWDGQNVWRESIVLVARLALGLGLFFGANGVSRAWHRIQGHALEPRPLA